MQPGTGVVDTAAEDGTMGRKALEDITSALRPFGLRPLFSSHGEGTGSGVGGQNTILGIAQVPVGLGGLNGVIQFTVYNDTEAFRIPPLPLPSEP